ncbi:MAG: phytanoyl-CoA dioxygenase family protein [Actinomycetota bacterium]
MTKRSFSRDGFVSPVPVVAEAEAATHRRALEMAEDQLGPLHYRNKVHTILPSAHELATHPALLDAVEACIGPDILVYNVTYIIKEPQTASHVSWHQDLTYWGLSDADAQVSAWLALAPATEESGCMRMLAGSHREGPIRHVHTEDATNVLLMGQTVDTSATAAAEATLCVLAPGEASLHHGWTVHASGPNLSDDRRIGLNIQYLAPHNLHTGGGHQSAMLARGEDRHRHFETDQAPTADLDPAAVDRWEWLDAMMKDGFLGN